MLPQGADIVCNKWRTIGRACSRHVGSPSTVVTAEVAPCATGTDALSRSNQLLKLGGDDVDAPAKSAHRQFTRSGQAISRGAANSKHSGGPGDGEQQRQPVEDVAIQLFHLLRREIATVCEGAAAVPEDARL